MSNKIRYKLTDQNMQTRNNYRWELGKWQEPIGNSPTLCRPGWLHCYSHPLIAVFMNPIHADIKKPRLFKCEVKGNHLEDNGLKEGWKKMKLIKEIPLPEISLTQKIAFGILCALEVYKEETFVKWANNWLSGEDRSSTAAYAAARAARAARVARAAAYAAAAAAAVAADADADDDDVAACAADAADTTADAKPINLIKLAKQAMKVK